MKVSGYFLEVISILDSSILLKRVELRPAINDIPALLYDEELRMEVCSLGNLQTSESVNNT